MEQTQVLPPRLNAAVELPIPDSRHIRSFKYSGSAKMIFDFELDENWRAERLAFWQNAKHSHAQQHCDHAYIEIAKNRKPIFCAGIKRKKIVLAGIFSIKPLFLNNRYSLEAVCLRGPVFDDINAFKEFLPRIIKQFQDMGVGSVRISPYWQYPEAIRVEEVLREFGFAPYYPKEGPRSSTGYIDLSRPAEQVYASMSKSAKEAVKRMDRLGIAFKDVTDFDDAIASYRSFNNMRARGGMTQMSLDEFRATFEHILRDGDIGLLTNAYKDGCFLGTLWSMRGPEVAHLMGYAVEHEITNKLVKRYTLGYMLWWHHLLWAKQKGARLYDVEGYKANAENSNPLKRILEFKQNLGTSEANILSEHTFVCNRMTHFVYRGFRFVYKTQRFIKSLGHQWKKRTCKDFSRQAMSGKS